jgi:hypothetical protein
MSWRRLAISPIVVEQRQRSTQIITAMAKRYLDRSDQELDINELERLPDRKELSRTRLPDLAGSGTVAVAEVAIEI